MFGGIPIFPIMGGGPPCGGPPICPPMGGPPMGGPPIGGPPIGPPIGGPPIGGPPILNPAGGIRTPMGGWPYHDIVRVTVLFYRALIDVLL